MLGFPWDGPGRGEQRDALGWPQDVEAGLCSLTGKGDTHILLLVFIKPHPVCVHQTLCSLALTHTEAH